jgi:hypothetical protein
MSIALERLINAVETIQRELELSEEQLISELKSLINLIKSKNSSKKIQSDYIEKPWF